MKTIKELKARTDTLAADYAKLDFDEAEIMLQNSLTDAVEYHMFSGNLMKWYTYGFVGWILVSVVLGLSYLLGFIVCTLLGAVVIPTMLIWHTRRADAMDDFLKEVSYCQS